MLLRAKKEQRVNMSNIIRKLRAYGHAFLSKNNAYSIGKMEITVEEIIRSIKD